MRAVTELQGRCPCSADGHLMSDLDVHAACRLDERLLSQHFQHLAWIQAGRVGIKCGQEGCRGIVQVDGWLPRPCALACPGEGCSMRYCGRCRMPWGSSDEHQCADLQQVRFCPGCAVATERISGCNAMVCGNPSCRSSWCWECGCLRSLHGCGHFVCKNPRDPQGRALGGAPAPPAHDAAAMLRARLVAVAEPGLSEAPSSCRRAKTMLIRLVQGLVSAFPALIFGVLLMATMVITSLFDDPDRDFEAS